MQSEISRSGPDPARVTSQDDLALELGLLRSRAARGTRTARVTLRDLACRVGEPRSTIHAYLAGKRLAPAQVLDQMVIALGATSAEQRGWAEAWYRVSAHRDAAHRTPPPVSSPGSAVPHQLPQSVHNFTGRAELLAEFDELLSRSQSAVILAVSGTAGVGKSALAVHWAQTRGAEFPDGQLHMDLRGFDPEPPIQPSQALARFLRALGVPGAEIPRELSERAALYRSLLSGRRMLILLDNARDVEQVRSLLPGTPSCSAAVTSRDSLTGLIARHGAYRVELDVLPLADAVDLLRGLIGPALDSSPQDGVRLAEQCARLPLALRIAAELAISRPGSSVTDLIGELAAPEDRLDLLGAGEDLRTAIRAVFSWSYQRLPAQPAAAFRLLGLHPGPDLDPAALAALSDCGVAETQRTLALLSRSHLVRQGRSGRYSLHELLRVYAGELALSLDAEPDRWMALTRLSDHYLHTATRAMDLLFPAGGHRRPDLPAGVAPVPLADAEAAHRWLDAERANIVAVASQAGQQGRPQYTIRVAQTVAHYLDSAGQHADAVLLNRSAHAAASSCPDPGIDAATPHEPGVGYLRLGRPEASGHLQQPAECGEQSRPA